jgi:hypothetical protein
MKSLFLPIGIGIVSRRQWTGQGSINGISRSGSLRSYRPSVAGPSDIRFKGGREIEDEFKNVDTQNTRKDHQYVQMG